MEPLAADIARVMPMFTDHSITHADALWDTASLLCGPEFPLNPAEAFVLGGAFLLHDLGMGLASTPDGLRDIEADPQFDDLVAGAIVRLRRADPSTRDDVVERTAHDQAVGDLLRLRHAARAEKIMSATFRTSDGEPFYLLQDTVLRHTFGSLIARIAHSHWWPVSKLRDFQQRQGSCVDHPVEWEVDPLKIACILRLADAAHIDHRRAPTYLHAFRRPEGRSRDHWYFQERLTRPRVSSDRLQYTATRPFGREEAAAWWLAYDTVRTVNEELRAVDALCADLGRPRFAVRSVAGADSPERLALYIQTEGWDPLDAHLRVGDTIQLIANLGGRDLYGNKPEVAVRELIANAIDATKARAAHEGQRGAAVTVRLANEQDDWWLIVEDHGIGMSPSTMVSALTDFGGSRWQSPETLKEFPGLLTKGFQPIGRFGIGFFAVFMVADEVQVRSLAYDEAPRSTHVLEFQHGVSGRPLIREAEYHERLRDWGTVVAARLRHDPRSDEGLFKTSSPRLTHTELLHSRITRLCALSEVDIRVQGPDDPAEVRIIRGNDWTHIPPAELFRRIYRREEAGYLDRVIYDGYEKLFIDHATDMRDADNTITGRAIMASGWEVVHPDLRWTRPPEALVYVGGLQADEFDYCMGAFSGVALTADRLKAFPGSVPDLQAWVASQAEKIATSTSYDAYERGVLGLISRGLGVEAPRLPLAVCRDRELDRDALIEWLQGREHVLLVSAGSFVSLKSENRPPVFLTFEGRMVRPPDEWLIVGLNPPWLFPEEVLERPRDERFVDAVEGSSWNPCTWWYDTGNFGAPGLVVRTVAEVWGIDIVTAVELMEPLHLQEDGDLRPALRTEDGQTLRVTAIRMRRP